MSTVGPAGFDSTSATPLPGNATAATGPSAPAGIDPRLVQQTKNEIRSIVQEITQLSQSELLLDQFYEEFLRRVVQALASHGGAVWTADENGQLLLQYQVSLPAEELNRPGQSQRHMLLLQNVQQAGQPTLVPPQSGAGDETDAGNPTDYLLILVPLKIDDEAIGVLEIFQRSGGGPTTQRGYLRFLAQMGDLANNYLKSRRLRQLGDRQAIWEHLEQFLRRVHQSLDSEHTCYAIVNESRRFIQCDRVSVTLRRRGREQVIAVSGLDTIDRRAEEIRRLGALATAVATSRRPLWVDHQTVDLPPQIEEPLQEYVDHSQCLALAVVPLEATPPDGQDEHPGQGTTLGTLIVEQLGDRRLPEGLVQRVEAVADHSATALAKSLQHESLFLLPLWQALGRVGWIREARNWPKILWLILATSAVLFVLAVVPRDFELAARGTLQPSSRREVFAPDNGVIVDVPVRHEQLVQEGDVLARLMNNELEFDIADLLGRKRTVQQRIRTVKRSQLDRRHARLEEQNELSGQLHQLLQQEASIDREMALQQEKRERLTIRSEMSGQVVTWNVGHLLARRPVQRGQALMTVVDPRGDWELELYMPERKMGHVAHAASQGTSLPVTFILGSHPERELTGQVIEVHRSAEVRGEEGNTVLIRVKIDKSELPELRSDTTVTAKVGCGRRSLGYVLFHELLETVQKQILFWL